MPKSTTAAPASGAADSDVDLTARIRGGLPDAAEAAFDELYRRHRAAVLAYARSCTREPHTAEDLASEAFARALRAVRGGSGPDGPWRPYLLTTVRRTAAAWSRAARHTELSPDFEAWLTRAPTVESSEEGTLRREDANLVLRAFRSLPERWQTALWHSAVEDEPPDRIAPLLGLSASGVASLTARAREGLREAYLAERAGDATAPDECRHYTGLLAASVRRGGRRLRAQRSLEHHLAACQRCRRASLELRELNSSLSAALPTGLLLWTGACYGAETAGASGAVVSGAVASGGYATGVGETVTTLGTATSGGAAASTGLAATLKAGGVGAAILLATVGGYTILPDGGNPPEPPPAPTVTSAAPAPDPERSGSADASPSHEPSADPSRAPVSSGEPSSSRTPPGGGRQAAPSWSPAADDRTTLPIAATGRCMDIGAAAGAQPYEAACDGGRSQQWELLVDLPPVQEVRIRNYATGMCLKHSGTQTDGAPVRQQRDACDSEAATAHWKYFLDGDDKVIFTQRDFSGQFLGLNDWRDAAEGASHAPDIGTTANYENTLSLRFRYEGGAFGY